MAVSTFDNSATSSSLIDRIKLEDAHAWERLTVIYTPIVYGWARRAQLQQDDAADVVQEVFQAVASGIGRFGREGRPTRFRAWLWGITRFKLQDHFRRLRSQPQPAGGGAGQTLVAELSVELLETDGEFASDGLAHRALQMVKTDFHEVTWQAFCRVTIEGHLPADVAHDLGISVGSVYTAKSRVLAHLRHELEDLK